MTFFAPNFGIFSGHLFLIVDTLGAQTHDFFAPNFGTFYSHLFLIVDTLGTQIHDTFLPILK